MTHCRYLFATCGLALLLGCPSVENADVEHNNVCIDLSPDGTTVVFSSADGELYLFDIAKSSSTRLTESERIESYPSFSPDGKRIVFAAAENKSTPSSIYVLDLSDLSVTGVTESTKQSDILPRFTADGNQIVFARAYRHRPYSLGGWTWDKWDVCIVGTDRSGLTRLTNESYYQLFRIVPRDDGTFVFAADSMNLDGNPRAALYTVASGEPPSRLIPQKGISDANVNAWASDPIVSSDGKTIAYCSDRKKSFWYDVCVQANNAECDCLVGEKSRYNRYPDFFPDGQQLVFLAGTEFNAGSRPIYSLWQVSLDGQTKELAPSGLFTTPTNWMPQQKAEQ